MRYDIEGDWHLLGTCNFRCSYCFLPQSLLASPMRIFASPEEWRRAFDATGLTWLLHLTGGEPTVYSDFAALCASLADRHFLSLNTNLSRPSIHEFSARVHPSRVSFINAGLHYDERLERQGMANFLRHLCHLQDGGFPIFVSVVATPEVLERMETIVKALLPAGVWPVPKLLRGLHAGKRFPEGYSAADRDRFRLCSHLARESYGKLLTAMPEAPTINPFEDDSFVDGVPSYTGRICEAGHRFVDIRADGTIKRCAETIPLGNLLDGTFVPRSEAAPCDTKYCYYFCQKHSKSRVPALTSPEPAFEEVA